MQCQLLLCQCNGNAVPMQHQCSANASANVVPRYWKAILMLSNAGEKQCFCQERKILGKRRQEEEKEEEEEMKILRSRAAPPAAGSQK